MKIYIHYSKEGDKSYSNGVNSFMSPNGLEPIKSEIIEIDDKTGEDFLNYPDKYEIINGKIICRI